MIDLEGKSAILHAIGGILFGLLANYVYGAGLGIASGLATLLFLFIGLVIMGHVSAMVLGRNSLSQKQWLGTGGTSYFFTAIVFWIISFNGVICL
ncbi:conserved hypothetical protein [Methanococcus aeolicus Nankai-3]|uniref:Uncharacterized protein n=1 Tax=Methanococcus aeolicus (strain ATCC BAA-1280 / DSM 17508 / OCM 812 / Nankai-3) TaxID=419665 RepID=A6UWB2_META3|nr:conserved hypothetical protein [Methanococcus aeolicus Nankai-3]